MDWKNWFEKHKGQLFNLLLIVLVIGFGVLTNVRVSEVESDVEEMVSPLAPYLPEEWQNTLDELMARWDEIESTVVSIEDWFAALDADTGVEYAYQTAVYMTDGGDKQVVASGGEVEYQSGSTLDIQAGATAGIDDLTVDDTLDVNGNIDLDGDGLDVNITAGFSMDADAASNINVAGAGIDLTLESEAGSLVLKGDEAVATGITLDANDAVTTGVTIQVGSVSGLSIDGGLTDIGGGTYATADGDNDLGIDGDLEVNTNADLDGTLNVAGAVTFQNAFYPSFTNLVVTDTDTITPTYVTYALDSVGPATITLNATGTEGQLLILIGDDANNITINDTNVRTNDGAAQVIGQYDVIMWVYQDSEWIEISESNNS